MRYGLNMHIMTCLISDPCGGNIRIVCIFKCGPASEPLSDNYTLFPDVRNCSQLVGASHASHIFHSSDFLEKNVQFFIRYIIGISQISQNAIRQHQTLFYCIVSHHM